MREKERERNINVWLPLKCPPPRDLAHNPGMCPCLLYTSDAADDWLVV